MELKVFTLSNFLPPHPHLDKQIFLRGQVSAKEHGQMIYSAARHAGRDKLYHMFMWIALISPGAIS